MLYKHSSESIKDYSIFAKEYSDFHSQYAKTYVKKTWKESREIIRELKITEKLNGIVSFGNCKFGSVIIYFRYNHKINEVVSTSYLQDMTEEMGFYNEKNIPYLISQAICWKMKETCK